MKKRRLGLTICVIAGAWLCPAFLDSRVIGLPEWSGDAQSANRAGGRFNERPILKAPESPAEIPKQTINKSKDLLEQIQIVTAVFTSIATVILTCIALSQRNIARRQATIMEKQTDISASQQEMNYRAFKSQYRPIIKLLNITCAVDEGGLDVHITIINIGDTDANVFRLDSSIGIGAPGMPGYQTGGGYALQNSLIIKAGEAYCDSRHFPPEPVGDIYRHQRATKKIEISGLISYRADGGRAYHLRFTRTYDAVSLRFVRMGSDGDFEG
jgi:hypothetical protein